MPERKGVLTIIDDRLRRRNAKAKRSLAEIASATSQKFREQRNRAPLSLSARGPSYLPGLCAAAHKVTPLNHSRDLDTLLRNFFVSFCLGSKAAKAKGLFRRRTSISRRGSEATEIIWRKSGLSVFVGSTTALFRAATPITWCRGAANRPRRTLSCALTSPRAGPCFRDAALPRSSARGPWARPFRSRHLRRYFERAVAKAFQPKKAIAGGRLRYLFRPYRTLGSRNGAQP
jgi:hypothetical protein